MSIITLMQTDDLLTPGIVIDTTQKLSAIVGDSILLQNTSVSGSVINLNSFGPIIQHNYREWNRFPIQAEDNYGGGGGSLQDMASSAATDLANKAYTTVWFMGGANDIPTSNTLEQMKVWASIVRDAILAIGADVFWYTVLPRTLDSGVPLTTVQLTKLLDFNAWIVAQHDPANGVYVFDCYAAMSDGSNNPIPENFQDENGKLLHPSVRGGYVMSTVSASVTNPYFGKGSLIPSIGTNIFVNDMSGTTGTLKFANTASGVLADGTEGYGFGNNVPSSRVFSKTVEGYQNIDINIPDVGSSSVNYYFEEKDQISYDFPAASKAYAWAITDINSGSKSDGPQLFFKGNGDTRIGFNKAGGTSGNLPADDIGSGLVVTDLIEMSGTQLMDLYILGQIDANGQAGAVNFNVRRWGITLLP